MLIILKRKLNDITCYLFSHAKRLKRKICTWCFSSRDEIEERILSEKTGTLPCPIQQVPCKPQVQTRHYQYPSLLVTNRVILNRAHCAFLVYAFRFAQKGYDQLLAKSKQDLTLLACLKCNTSFVQAWKKQTMGSILNNISNYHSSSLKLMPEMDMNF